MSIEGFTDSLRPERLGKIRLGIKVPSQNAPNILYPRATNYFVLPPELIPIYGEKPTEIHPIWLPSDNPDDFIRHHYEYWTQSLSLLCQGNGREATAKMDTQTGAFADKDTKEWVRKKMSCPGEECAYYKAKQCRAMMHFDFLLPEVPGIGVWTLTTTSWNSARNIMSAVKQLQSLVRMVKDGHIAGVPITLKLAPQDAQPPGGKKKTIFVVHLVIPLKLGEVVRLAQTPISARFRLAVGPMTVEEIERDGIPEDLAGPFEEEDKTEPPKTAPPKREKIKEADVLKLADQSIGFGEGSWNGKVVPMMKELFGGIDSYEKLDADQAFKLWTSIKAQAAANEATQRLAKEKAERERPPQTTQEMCASTMDKVHGAMADEVKGAAASLATPQVPATEPPPSEPPPPPPPPAKAKAKKASGKPQSQEEKDQWNARMRLTEALKERMGGREQGIQWLKDNYGTVSTAEMSKEQLEAALARINEQKPESTEEESPF